MQNYLSMMKEGETVLDKKVDLNFDKIAGELKIKAPFFNYIISQKNHKGELISVSMSIMKNKDYLNDTSHLN